MKRIIFIAALSVAGSLPAFAELDFAEKSAELKAKAADELVTAKFAFKNTGSKAAGISKVDFSCGCLSATPDKKSYEPGESGMLDVVFKIGSRRGYEKNKVVVHSGGKKTTLEVGVQIPHVVKIDPEVTVWTVGEKPAPKTIKVKVEHKDPIKVLKAECGRAGFDVELKTVKEGYEYDIVLTPTTTELGLMGRVMITTDSRIKKHATKAAYFAISRKKKEKK